MGKAIGLLELKSIPVGIETADEMLKAANVLLLLASPICPGKFVVIVNGDIGAVKSSVKRGEEIADTFLVTSHIINNVHPDLPAAITGTSEITGEVKSVGSVETMSALSSVLAGDIAAKAANVQLIEIRIARGLGGKGFLLLTGEVSAVRAAVDACIRGLAEYGDITSTCVIPSIDPGLVSALL